MSVGKLVSELTANSISWGTLPEGYRPAYMVMILCQTYMKYPASIVINVDGEIKFYKGYGNETWPTATNINITGMYFAD
jgi:hypothetical protein